MPITKEYIISRLIEIEHYLDKNWKGLSDNFVERLLAKIEYEKLTKQLNDKSYIN